MREHLAFFAAEGQDADASVPDRLEHDSAHGSHAGELGAFVRNGVRVSWRKDFGERGIRGMRP
jgi:hypothetical protein